MSMDAFSRMYLGQEMHSFIDLGGRPDRLPDAWIDAELLVHAEQLDGELVPTLVATRDLVLSRGDEASRRTLDEFTSTRSSSPFIHRVREILSRRPTTVERETRALVDYRRGRMHIALAHEIPCAGARATVRIASTDHIEPAWCGARRIASLPPDTAREWRGLGHAEDPVSIWESDVPACFEGEHDLSIEIAPNPSSLNEAMLISRAGAGRTLVLLVPRGQLYEERTAFPVDVLPSGWSYLKGDRTQGMAHPFYPNGAPMPRTFVRVPDLDLFALCAERTWTGSLRDSIWLRRRADGRSLR